MSSSIGANHKPLLDEAGFEQLLAAAYVLQQHNDSLRAKDPRADPVAVLTEIAETQLTEGEHERSLVPESPSLPPRFYEDVPSAEPFTICRVCGQSFGVDEEFCGGCGVP